MAKKKAAKVAKKKCPTEVLIVGSKVRAHIKAKGAMMSGDLLDALNCCVTGCLDKAIQRAKDNKRSTVRPQDI